MNTFELGRRDFLRLGLASGLLGVVGCSSIDRPVLRSPGGLIPKELLVELPSTWRFKPLEINSNNDLNKEFLDKRTDFVALSDGWIQGLPAERFLPISSIGISEFFSENARNYDNEFGNDYLNKILPIGISPWVMIFRNGETWIDAARESWEVLFDPKLKGQIILPNSPRLIISLLDKIGSSHKLRELREQSKTFDDLNAINWLLTGRARVAVLPLQRCMKILIRDPRLNVALPKIGAPLNWTVLLRPSSGQNELPLTWIKKSWEFPLLGKLLTSGWIPPVDYSKLLKGKKYVLKKYQSIVLPSKSTWEKCWSLFPLNHKEIKNLEKRWIESIP